MTFLIVAVIAAGLATIAYTVAHDDDWSARAGRTIMEADIVRHPLAKGEEVCILVTHKGAVATVPCKSFEHLIINPAPQGLPEME